MMNLRWAVSRSRSSSGSGDFGGRFGTEFVPSQPTLKQGNGLFLIKSRQERHSGQFVPDENGPNQQKCCSSNTAQHSAVSSKQVRPERRSSFLPSVVEADK